MFSDKKIYIRNDCMTHESHGNGVYLQEARVHLVKTRGRPCAVAGLLLSIVADPVFVGSFVKHLICVTADTWKF